MSSVLDNIAETLRNAYGDRARIMVDIGACDCPNPDCEGLLDTQGEGSLDDTAWCDICEWEGTCSELLTG